MEATILKKRLSTYLSDGGHLKNVGDDVLHDLLLAWEGWSGTNKDFYKAVGFTHRKLALLLGKAKRLKREGHFGESAFKEIITGGDGPAQTYPLCADGNGCIQLSYQDGRVISFPDVSQLKAFMDKAG